MKFNKINNMGNKMINKDDALKKAYKEIRRMIEEKGNGAVVVEKED